MKNSNSKQIIFDFLPGILLGIAFAAIIYRSMTWGPWAYNDSSAYVSAARNLASGNGSVIQHSTGKVKLLTEFPPFYPFFLSLFGGVNGDYISVIRLLNSILFGLSIFLLYFLINSISKNPAMAIITVSLYAIFEHSLKIFTGAMSETLFIPLSMFAWILFISYIKNNRKLIHFIALVLISAILPVTRYAGIVFVGIIFLALLVINNSNSFKKKLSYALTYFFLSFFPIIIWASSLLTQFGKFGGKRFNFEWSIFREMFLSFKEMLAVISRWIPYTSVYSGSWISAFLQSAAGLLIFAIFVYSTALFFRERDQKPFQKASILFFFNINIIAYIGLIVFMHSTSSPRIDIIDRTVIPLFPLLLISLTTFLSLMIDLSGRKMIPAVIFLILSIIFIRYNFLHARVYLHRLSTDGIGYTSRDYMDSGIISAIKKIDQDRITISNLSGFVLFHTNEYPIFIENFPHYRFGDGTSYGESQFRDESAALILFKSEFFNFYGAAAQDLYQKVTDSLIIEFEDQQAAIFSYQPSIQP